MKTGRAITREDLSRQLLMQGAFATATSLLRSRDEVSLLRLQRLKVQLEGRSDPRSAAIGRIEKRLRTLMESEGVPPRV